MVKLKKKSYKCEVRSKISTASSVLYGQTRMHSVWNIQIWIILQNWTPKLQAIYTCLQSTGRSLLQHLTYIRRSNLSANLQKLIYFCPGVG